MVSLVPYGALIVNRKPSGSRGEDEKHLKNLDGMMDFFFQTVDGLQGSTGTRSKIYIYI